MRRGVTYPILKRMMVTLMFANFIISVTSWHLAWWLVRLLIPLAGLCAIVLGGACQYYAVVYKLDKSVHKWHMALVCSRISSSCKLKCPQVVLAISTLKNIFPLDTKTQDYHLKYSTKCHMADILSLKEVTFVDEWSILAISRCDSLRPLGIMFGPFANRMHGTKYRKQCSSCTHPICEGPKLARCLQISCPDHTNIFV